ncbi:MAG: DNA adenine methylase [Deltaproteobacteria bacterium]|nr:DNA adenine methylase [Deltaproteobacteria bacterium]
MNLPEPAAADGAEAIAGPSRAVYNAEAGEAPAIGSKVPHIVQYQGSKRFLAPRILEFMPLTVPRIVEPFAGTAAVSVAAAAAGRAGRFLLNDLNAPVSGLLSAAVEDPGALAGAYGGLWEAQFSHPGGHVSHYVRVRELFNSGDRSPANTLYLLSRCVKGAVRYSGSDRFNQSPDARRHGTLPGRARQNLQGVSSLLRGRASFSSLDYREVLEEAVPGDLVYMDPPYQGVSGGSGRRYLSGVAFGDLCGALRDLNRRGVDFILSYDGRTGARRYGLELPAALGCARVLLRAGPSAQATLLGRRDVTHESLYLSERLAPMP